jgi:hypothetical protein
MCQTPSSIQDQGRCWKQGRTKSNCEPTALTSEGSHRVKREIMIDSKRQEYFSSSTVLFFQNTFFRRRFRSRKAKQLQSAPTDWPPWNREPEPDHSLIQSCPKERAREEQSREAILFTQTCTQAYNTQTKSSVEFRAQ